MGGGSSTRETSPSAGKVMEERKKKPPNKLRRKVLLSQASQIQGSKVEFINEANKREVKKLKRKEGIVCT